MCSWCALCRNGVVVRDEASFTISCCCSPHSLGMGTSSLVRETNLQYVTRGLWLVVVLFGCFLALFVPFSVIGDDGDMDANLPIFVANFVVFWNALLRCSMSRPALVHSNEIGA